MIGPGSDKNYNRAKVWLYSVKQKTGLSNVVLHSACLEATRFTTQDGTKTHSLFEDGEHQELLVVQDSTKTDLLFVIKRPWLYVHDGW